MPEEEEEEEFQEEEERSYERIGFKSGRPDPRVAITHRVDVKIEEFIASRRSFEVSSSARNIIHEAINALRLEPLFWIENGNLSRREQYVNRAIDTLPQFLKFVADRSSRMSPPIEPKLISGILLLQYMRKWGQLIGCSCWPRV